MTVMARCKHDGKKYCKNWDGKGNICDHKDLIPEKTESCRDFDGEFNGQCPSNIKTCEFKVTPTPSPKLGAQ